MEITYLGWAGAQLATASGSVVIDPLQDAAAVFAWVGGGPVPEVAAAQPGAVAGLVTHLHRDHADAAALAAALAAGAPVFEPPAAGGDELENAAIAQADAELGALPRTRLAPWETATVDGFTLTALPAADGTGDPQVSWLVEGDGARVLHLGDTMNHGYWWRIARRHGPFDAVLVPVNGAVVGFPHRRPVSPQPAVLDPEQAATAVAILGARVSIPIHAEGYEIERVYEPVPDAARRFAEMAEGARVLEAGETISL